MKGGGTVEGALPKVNGRGEHERFAVSRQLACEECDLLVLLPDLAEHHKAVCPRCDFLLEENQPNRFERMVSYSIAGLIFFALSIPFPFLVFSAQGQEHTITLFQSVFVLFDEGHSWLAFGVFTSIFTVPVLLLLAMAFVAGALRSQRFWSGTRFALKLLFYLLPWAMAEIFLVGILVSFIKIVALADVNMGASFWAYVLATLSTTMAVRRLDRHLMWQLVARAEDV